MSAKKTPQQPQQQWDIKILKNNYSIYKCSSGYVLCIEGVEIEAVINASAEEPKTTAIQTLTCDEGVSFKWFVHDSLLQTAMYRNGRFVGLLEPR